MKNLKLNVLAAREMSAVHGGGDYYCPCGCAYADSGGSSMNSNCAANSRAGYTNTAGTPKEYGKLNADGTVTFFWSGTTV